MIDHVIDRHLVAWILPQSEDRFDDFPPVFDLPQNSKFEAETSMEGGEQGDNSNASNMNTLDGMRH